MIYALLTLTIILALLLLPIAVGANKLKAEVDMLREAEKKYQDNILSKQVITLGALKIIEDLLDEAVKAEGMSHAVDKAVKQAKQLEQLMTKDYENNKDSE